MDDVWHGSFGVGSLPQLSTLQALPHYDLHQCSGVSRHVTRCTSLIQHWREPLSLPLPSHKTSNWFRCCFLWPSLLSLTPSRRCCAPAVFRTSDLTWPVEWFTSETAAPVDLDCLPFLCSKSLEQHLQPPCLCINLLRSNILEVLESKKNYK